MTGGHHLATGAASYLLVSSIPMVSSLYHGPLSDTVGDVCHTFSSFYTVPLGIPSAGIASVAGFFVSIVLFGLGTLLPDVDSQGSILGRVVYLPIRHRTWTHSIWPLLVLFALSFAWIGFFWIALGMFFHLLMDSVSRQGVCWFYPISKYRYYSGGAAVKVKHLLKFYRTGSKMEKFVCYTYVVLCVCVFAVISVASWRAVSALAAV